MKQDLFSMLDGEFAEGSEILDLMQIAVLHPDANLTEREKCRLFMGRYLFAAAVEATNRASEKFSVSHVDLVSDFWAMAGEAIACVTVQAFDSSPRARRIVRKNAKTCVMSGYDHAVALVEKYDTGAKP